MVQAGYAYKFGIIPGYSIDPVPLCQIEGEKMIQSCPGLAFYFPGNYSMGYRQIKLVGFTGLLDL
jgi:hypothetical protein